MNLGPVLKLQGNFLFLSNQGLIKKVMLDGRLNAIQFCLEFIYFPLKTIMLLVELMNTLLDLPQPLSYSVHENTFLVLLPYILYSLLKLLIFQNSKH